MDLNALTIILLAIGFIGISKLIYSKLRDEKKVKNIEKIIKKHREEYIKALKEKNFEKQKELDKKFREINKLSSELLLENFKPMIINIIILIIFLQIAKIFYVRIELPFSIPKGIFIKNNIIYFNNILGSRGLFFYSILILGIIYEIIKKLGIKLKKR